MGAGELITGVAIGVAATPLTLLAIRPLKRKGASVVNRSTTSSAGGGATAYETRKATDEYIQFHFGDPKDVMPYPDGPKSALGFPARCALLCERFCEANKDFTGERGGTLALDVGCAVGGSTFELSRAFTDCLGIDYSRSFVAAAQEMKNTGFREYEATVEGELTKHYIGSVPHDIDRSQVRFMQGDACNLPAELASFHAVLAANLLCRLPDPIKFLDRLPSLVRPGGVAVLVSPYSWLESWTPKSKWLGGYKSKEGGKVHTANVLSELMTERGFTLVHEEDMPFLIREHWRKFQWGCSHATVWLRNKQH